MTAPRLFARRLSAVLAPALLCVLWVACAATGPGSAELHRWWSGLGAVVPHDTFPADCNLCHLGADWQTLRASFSFDHHKETGHALTGAHAQGRCLRCHNDRGPVQTFASRGCVGCHEDKHMGELGTDCASCHDEFTWRATGQVERHNRTRFPLTGAHLNTACHRCHPGAQVGEFVPADTECLSCHRSDLEGTTNPRHIPLGWVSNCDRCHQTTGWRPAQLR